MNSELLTCKGIALPPPAACDTTTENPRPPKRPRHQRTPSLGSPAEQPDDSLPPATLGACARIHPSFNVNPHCQWAWPSAKNLPFLFPHHMCEMIAKQGDKAAIMLPFTADPSQCRLVWGVVGPKVPFVARELFETDIWSDRRRYIRQGGVASIEVYDISLGRSRADKWDGIVGEFVGQAL